MKQTLSQTQIFRELTSAEKYALSGGGFAYDAGRFIRFVCIAGPNGQWTPMAILDACAVACQ